MKTSTQRNLLAAAALVLTLLPQAAYAQVNENEYAVWNENASWKAKPRKSDLFTVDDKKFHGGFSVGWVAKEWTTKANGITYHEDLWGNRNKVLNGVQFGVHFEQCIRYGVGWRTGLYYEWYISHDHFLRENGWDRFNEHCLYIPLHVQFRLPIAPRNENISVTPYAGIGFNIAMKGRFKNGPRTDANGVKRIDHGYVAHSTGSWLGDIISGAIQSATGGWTEYVQYDVQNYVYDDYTPRKANIQVEFGLALRIYAAQLTFTYSRGITDHRLYNFAPSRQNKVALNLGVAF
ncbi:MAG: hypothetical protein IKQ37_10025 [Bacteroidaceae bacterium]|nr:hypothetical protein [Bacteroidaceae bacterium]